MKKQLLLASSCCAVFLAGCGGGGGDSAAEVAIQHNVNPAQATARAGDTIMFRMDVKTQSTKPSEMRWEIAPAESNAGSGGVPLLFNEDCATSQVAPPVREGFYGEGTCTLTIKLPAGMRNGAWDVISIAGATGAQSVKKARLQVVSASEALQVLAPTEPIPGNVGRQIAISAPIVVQPLKTYSDIRYEWKADNGNPSKPTLLGDKSQRLLFVPEAPGQYTFTVTASGKINGQPVETTQTVVVLVDPVSIPENVTLPDFITTTPGQPFTLEGVVDATQQDFIYKYRWEQIAGPTTIKLSGANTTRATGLAPLTTGLYSFDFVVEKTSPYGATTTTRYRVHLWVGGDLVSNVKVRFVSESLVAGGVVAMIAESDSRPGVINRYEWKQVGGPATVTLSHPNDREVSFLAPLPGVYVFELTVTTTDPNGATITTTQTVNAVVKPAS